MIMKENLFLSNSPLEHSSGQWENVLLVGLDGQGWTSQFLLASVSPWIEELVSSLPLHTDHCIILPDVTWKEVSAFFKSVKLSWAESGDLADLFKVTPSGQFLEKDMEELVNSGENLVPLHSESQNQECIQQNEQENVIDFIKKEEDNLEIKYEDFKNESEKTTKALESNKKGAINTKRKFMCEQCGKYFSSRYSIIRHRQQFGENCKKGVLMTPNNLACDRCGKQFSCIGNIVRHKRQFGEKCIEINRKTVCEKCGAQYKKLYKLQKHKQKYGDNCTKELRVRKKYDTKKHDLDCKICGKHFNRKANFRRHTKKQCAKLKGKCLQCQKEFTKINLEKHDCTKIYNYGPTKPVKSRKKEYSKDYIRKILKSPNIEFYNLDLILKNTPLISCEECEKKFITSYDLMRHKEKIHPIIYSCDYCEYSANEKRKLRMHHNENHKDILIPCNKCDKKCGDYRSLNKHIRIVHEGIRFPCDTCNYKAKCRVSLRNHINAIHKKLKLSCNQCDNKYTHPRNLRQHQKSEHEGIIYLCDKCDYKGTQNRSLQNHIQKVHEGINYQCDKCEYNGTNKRNFNTHIEKYHNEIKTIAT